MAHDRSVLCFAKRVPTFSLSSASAPYKWVVTRAQTSWCYAYHAL